MDLAIQGKGFFQILLPDGTTTQLLWTAVTPAPDTYSVTRGLLSALAPGQFGACLVDGLDVADATDSDVPPLGDGYFYLVQADSYDCGLSELGFGSDELERVNGDASACLGLEQIGDKLAD